MFKKLILVSSVLLAAGCGGGSGSGDTRIAVTASAGEGGTVSPASQRIAKGTQATLTVEADAIYTIQSVTGCGGALDGNTFRTGVVNADCAVTASFALKPLAVNLDALPQSVAENSSTSLNIVAENAKNSPIITLKAVGGYGNSFVTIEQTSDTLFNLVTQNVDREAIVELEVTAQDGNNISRVTTQRFSLVIENTSFVDSLARYQVIADNPSRILALTEEKLVSSAFRDAATILAIKDNTAPVAVAESSNTTYAELELQLSQNPVAAYLSGNISDTELSTAMASIESLMAAHVAPYIASINQSMPVIAAQGVPAVTPQQWFINTELNTVSLFVGNAELGQVNDGAWAFNSGFEYLDDVINSDCSL
ncbi:InlB B-repeat-containing protein [Rheinheimera sp. NSM]|uniref:InlB B-repeat-containing protein n=1 Tax=Rheinheimera sp. NSM TaxID=3457884 RepID=UPI004035BD35